MAGNPSQRLTRPSGAGTDRNIQVLVENLEILNGARGKGMDKAVLVRDLIDLGLATAKKGYNGVYTPIKNSDAGTGDSGLVEPPQVPIGVEVGGGFSTMLVSWNKPTYEGHAYTEVLRADADNFSEATLISTTTANLYSDQIGGGKIAFYWVRFVNLLDVKGPVQSTNGVRGETQADIGEILDILRGQIDESFLTAEFDSKLESVEALGLTNKTKITSIDGKILESKERTDILTAETEILAEAAMEAAIGVDTEGSKRRRVTAEIKLTQKTLVTDTGAMASQILTITAKQDDNAAEIIETKTALVTLDDNTRVAVQAITQAIDEQESTINGHTATISNHSQTIVDLTNGASSATTRLDEQQSVIDDNTSTITSQGQTLVSVVNKANANASTITSLSNTVNSQGSAIGSNTSNITSQGQTLVTVTNKANSNASLITSLSETLTQLSSTVGNNSSSISTQSQTLVTVTNTANSGVSKANAAQGTANTAVSAAGAAQGTANTNAQSISTMSQQITTLTSDLNGTKSTVTQNAQTVATINADGTTAYKALWGVKASIGNITAGIGLTVKSVNGVATSQCTVIADQFSVGSKTGSNPTIYPFIVTAGGVYIDTAYIKAANIQELVAGDVIADNIKAAATLTAPYIKGGRIEIGSKFTVDANGNMVANNAVMTNATVTGTINATAGVFNNVTINENCDVKGTVYANKIVGDVYKAEMGSIAYKDYTSISKNSYSTILTYSITAQNLDRQIEIPNFTVYYYGYSFFLRVLLNGVVKLTTQVYGNISPDFIMALIKNTSATVTLQGMYNGDDPEQTGPFPTISPKPNIPAQNVRHAYFKS